MTPEQELARLRAENEEQRRSISTLQASIAELQKQLAEAIGGNKELRLQLSDMQDKLDRLLFQIEKRNKKDYGKKTERHNPRQGETASPESSKSGDTSTEKKKNQNHKKNINSQKLPVAQKKHLVSPEERTCPFCLIDTEIFSQKITSQLERLTHSLVRLEHHQEVRSCQKCQQYVVTAKKPEPPFPGCLAGPHLLGSIIVGKLG
ncbi:MAG: hypothetical protein P4L61_00595, partial [Candidatus Pacebacteria bacterium]|nr:hypothetical protein [Candidatus Paceibacterota bacterium]